MLSCHDGAASDTYVVDNETSSTRLGLIGQTAIKQGTIAGCRIEMEFRGASSVEVSADKDNLGDDHAIRLRHAHWFIEDTKAGRLTLGLQSPATDDITIISLGSRMSDAALHYNNAFELRIPGPAVFQVKWGDLAHTVDSMRGNFVRYDTPAVLGFLLSAAAGEDDVWDVALRYASGSNSLRIAGGIGVMDNRELGVRDLRGSFSALHTPTGLFASVAGGLREDYGVAHDTPRDGHFYFAQLGLTKRYLPAGNTTLYAEYGRYNDFGVGRVFIGNLNLVPNSPDRRWALTNTEVDRWGFGIEQDIESAGLLLYAQFHHYEGGFAGVRCAEKTGTRCTPEAVPVRRQFTADPWQAVVLGARIQF